MDVDSYGHQCGVVSVAGRYVDIHDTTKSAENLMNSSRILSKAITAIRETTSIVASQGVKLKKYRNELFAYHLPTFISAPLMKRLFSHNELTRRIMTLHGNTADLIYVCRSVYECGKRNNIPAPLFYNCYEAVMRQVKVQNNHKQPNEISTTDRKVQKIG